MSDKNITEFGIGIDLDTSPANQKKGTYRFSLNTVNESEIGDKHIRSNEEANEECSALTPGFVPIGKCYIGNNQTIIFSVSEDNKVSEIGIQDDNCNYVVHVNDATSPDKEKLGFKVERQIQVTYRLRRGCERTIYFAGKDYPVRYFNFDKSEQFKKNGYWSSPKFGLYKKLEKFPTINEVKVQDNSGNLVPGSYNILVQHLDEDLNGTEFYELVRDINIYNDSLQKNYADIQGSSNIGDDTSPYKYSKTNKAISISLDAVDKNFTYVRFAFVERTSGNGQISGVKYSDLISVNSPIYTYTGDNAKQNGTIEEVELFNMNSGIQSAEHIEQIDNMLILANVKGEQAKICKLQKYASKIKTDCFVKDTILTSIDDKYNSKNPLVVHNGLGYQPGEIYSLGIVYIFEDYSTSPVFHIPGKSPKVAKNIVFSPEAGVYPMSNTNNQNQSEVYLDENTSCSSQTYWGYDSEGTLLRGQNVRHHRFPTRDEIGIGFVKKGELTGENIKYKRLQLKALGNVKKSDPDLTPPYVASNFSLIVRYNKNGVAEQFTTDIYPDSTIDFSNTNGEIYLKTDVISSIKLFYKEIGSDTETEIILDNTSTSIEQNNGLTYSIIETQLSENNATALYTAPILGLKFSNIDIPNESEIGKKVIGYQIVRQERKDIDKTILDSAVIFPMLKSGRNVSTGLLAPEYYLNEQFVSTSAQGSEDGTFPTAYNISKKNIMLLTPTHKFMNKTHDGFTSIEQVGTFDREYIARSAFSLQNVYDGSSAGGDEDKKTRDSDGFSLRHLVRYSGVKYKDITTNKLKIDNTNTRMYDIEAVNYADTEGSAETLYNLSSDNKALILSSSESNVDLTTYGPNKNTFPYVYLKKDNNNFYQNFRTNPYYNIDSEVHTTDTCKIFGGDTYITPLRHSNHVFGNAAVAMRRQKISAWQLIGSIVTILIGVVLSIIAPGLGTAATYVLLGGILTALGGIATGFATIIEAKKFSDIYSEKWHNNIDKTVFDFVYAMLFIRQDPQKYLSSKDWHIDKLYLSWEDDTFRWMGDIVGDFWFETSLNISLRVPPTNIENNYQVPLKSYMNDRMDKFWGIRDVKWVDTQIAASNGFHRFVDASVGADIPEENYFLNKITKKDSSRASGVLYQGISIPQVYLVNPDHYVTTGIKKFYTIPLEYDCCSECVECFPHRIHYSQQSFQEEKSDNYRMFLPNNYRDIEGETGEITNMFRWYNNLYIHTEEALWQMGRNYQERVTDNIVSFIGTGSYFEIPPQKILDDDTGSSAGTRHKWGMIKTPEGIFFPSENQKRFYQFTGKDLKPISELGISNWMKNNIEINVDKQFLKLKGYEYPNRNNPSSFLGSGFISTYDSRKERIIFTKKDFKFKDILFENDLEFCINGNTVTIFNNMAQTILDYTSQNWTYEGIVDCRLKFSKITKTTTTQTNTIQIWHPPVYETQVDNSVVWINQACVSGNCPHNGPSGSCDDNISIIDVDGITHGTTASNNNGSSFTMCISVNNFVSTTEPFSYGGDSQFYPDTVTYDIDESKVRQTKVIIQEGYWETQTIETPIEQQTIEYMCIDGVQHPIENYIEYDNSWTISYSLKGENWVSWHSYIPNFYINVPEKFYSWKHGSNSFWKHGKTGEYCKFYGVQYPWIIEYVSVSNSTTTKIHDSITVVLDAKKYQSEINEFYDVNDVFFNKMIAYNSRQCSGLMNLVLKKQESNYLYQQVNNLNNNEALVDRTERNWNINDFRDLRVDYNTPIFKSDLKSIQENYYIDKVLNEDSINYNKTWSQLENFRDKYLVVRLIFDKFVDTKMLLNFSLENETVSNR